MLELPKIGIIFPILKKGAFYFKNLYDFYKNTLELKTVRRHDDYSVYGDEFLNMLTLIIGNRIKNKFADSKILGAKTYRDVMKIFKQYKKYKCHIKMTFGMKQNSQKRVWSSLKKSCIVNFSGNFYKLKKLIQKVSNSYQKTKSIIINLMQ
ncbi:hypothetical protein NQV05_03305 [Mycoplasmopsis agalactiae]|nr:hypothetical protein NQV05_03305 [Mycoplasmopsis agalactiae]